VARAGGCGDAAAGQAVRVVGGGGWGAVRGKAKLRALFDCTHDGAGGCIEDATSNPEG
jgi:hypothetical protein